MPGLSSPRLPARRRPGGGCPVPAGNRSFPACSSGLACPCLLSALSSLFAAVSTRPRGATALRPRGPPTVGFGVRSSAWSRPVLCVSAWRRCVCRLASSPARGRPQPETSRRGAARWGAAPRGPRPRGLRPAGPTPWAAGAVGLGDGDGLGLGDGASAVSRAWGGAEEGGEQGRRHAGAPHVHGRVPVACIPPRLVSGPPSRPTQRQRLGPLGRGGGDWRRHRVSLRPDSGCSFPRTPPPTRSRGFHPGAASVGTLPPSLRCERSKFAEQEAGAWAGGPAFRVWGFAGLGGATRTPRTRHGNGRPAPLPFLRPRPVAQQDFSPDTERL